MNPPTRIVTPERRSDDVGDTALRPQLLSEFVGQAQARKNLSIFIEAARKRNPGEGDFPRAHRSPPLRREPFTPSLCPHPPSPEGGLRRTRERGEGEVTVTC